MKQSLNKLAIVATLSCASAPACSSAPWGTDLSVHPPEGIAVTADSRISRNYPQTKCLGFQREHKSVGFLCSSTSKQFTTDFGVTRTTETPDTQEQFRVASGMSIHDMMPTTINGQRLFATQVDCDDGDGPLYRATSTCHVAFMPMADSHFLYSNFVLSNEATSTPGIDERTVMAIWGSLVSATGAHK